MAENLGNDWSSTLNGAINNSVTSLDVTSATGAPSANFRIRIDDELMLVTAVSTNTFTVTRGVEGTTAASHSNGVAVAHVVTKTGLTNHMDERHNQVRQDIPTGDSFTIPAGYARIVASGFSIAGTLTIDGTLVVL